MADGLYIKRGKTIRGPFSESTLRSLLALGRVKPSDLISTKKDSGWKPISDVIRSHERKRPKPQDQISPIELDQIPTQEHQSPKLRRLLPLLAVVIFAAAGMLFLFRPTDDESVTGESVTGESSIQQVARSQAVTEVQSVKASTLDNTRSVETLHEATESDVSSAQNDDDVRTPVSNKSTPQVTRSATSVGQSEVDVPEKTRTVASADNGPPAVSPELTAFLKEHEIPLRDDIVDSLADAQKRVESANTGHVVIGRLRVPAGISAEEIICQTEVLPGGYFIDAVQMPGIPIWFWHAECAFAESVPHRDNDEIEWLGLTTLESDDSRATVRGIARVREFDVPANPVLDVSYLPPFVNTVSDQSRICEELSRKLSEASKPETSIDPVTGFFEVSNLLDASVQIHISSDDPEEYLQFFQPSMSKKVDLGICELSSASGTVYGQLPSVQKIQRAKNGTAMMQRIIRQIEDNSGNTAEGLAFSVALKNRINKEVRRCTTWLDEHGERSAVTVIALVHVPGVDMTTLQSGLSVSQAFYVPPESNNRTSPRLVYGVAKPGSEIKLSIPGFEPFSYQVKGTADGVEFIEKVEFTPLRRGDAASVDGTVSYDMFPDPQRNLNHLLYYPEPHVGLNGKSVSLVKKVTFYTDNGGTTPRSVPAKSSSVGRYSYERLSPGPYGLTLWSGSENYPRQLGIRVKSGQRLRLQEIRVYKRQTVDLRFVYRSRGYPDQFADQEATISVVPDVGSSPVEFRRRGQGGFGGGGRGFPQAGILEWSGRQSGNIVTLIPRVSGVFYTGPKRWSVLRLGKKRLTSYSSIPIALGDASGTPPAVPAIKGNALAPLTLSPGNVYLLQHTEYGYAIVVEVL